MTQNRTSVAKIAASIAFSALVALSVSIVPAHAGDRRDGYHDDHHDRGGRHRDQHGHWVGGYYPPPPVVYAPYYAPPPVVYGPTIGIAIPGLTIGFR